jgi:hypothetical protein
MMSGTTAAVLTYEIATATEAPEYALALLQYGLVGLLGCALIKLVWWSASSLHLRCEFVKRTCEPKPH